MWRSPGTSRMLGTAMIALVATGSCGGAATEPPLSEQSVGDLVAITDVSVIAMEAERVDANRTVVISGGRIQSIVDASAPVPAGATVISGKGKFLIPGLIDMHVHVRLSDMPSYVEHGVTSVRNMWGFSTLRTKPRTTDGALVHGMTSPAIYSASPGIDGPNPVWPETRVVTTPAEVSAAVEDFAAQGWMWLKAYTSLSAESYDALHAAASARGIRVIGHVPLAVSVQHALTKKQHSIEHLSGYDRALSGGQGAVGAWLNADLTLAPALAASTREAGTWNCPTSVVLDAIAARNGSDVRQRAAAARHAMIRALNEAGARIIAGTDAGIDITTPGTSMHDELAELVASGLSPYQALRAGTSDAAVFLDRNSEIGTIAAGKRGDVVLLRENPLVDVRNTRTIAGVMIRGRWFAR